MDTGVKGIPGGRNWRCRDSVAGVFGACWRNSKEAKCVWRLLSKGVSVEREQEASWWRTSRTTVRTVDFTLSEKGSHWKILSTGATQTHWRFKRSPLVATLRIDFGMEGWEEARKPLRKLLQQSRKENTVSWVKVRVVEMWDVVRACMYLEDRSSRFYSQLNVQWERKRGVKDNSKVWPKQQEWNCH